MHYEIIEGEQKTEEWLKIRASCLITGSIAKQVKGKGDAFLYEMLAMEFTERETKQAYGKHVDRGNDLEPEAREKYAKLSGNKVRQVSFIKNGRYGISPDGLIMKGEKINRLLEIKCPDTNNHIRYIIENKVPAEHEDQVIHGFVTLPDVDLIDFVSYDPKYKLKPLLIITARRSDYIVDITTTNIQYEKFVEKYDKTKSKLVTLSM